MDTLDFGPILKTKAIVVQSAVDRTQDPVIMIAEIGPGQSGPPAHIHLKQHETYEVLDGEAEFVLGNRRLQVKPGDQVEIPANTSHTFKNTGATWLKMRDTHQPALSFEEMMRELHGLVLSGNVTGFGDPKSLIHLSMLWVKHRDLQQSTQPPFFVMRVMAWIGRLLGYKL
jgi:mannose-6-phosphate isomerase-like protein (cupin superfamily)